MTIRLVALMSVILLLSLAAFGFTVQRYQDQVMQEVAHTVSEVGRATLRTLELETEALGEYGLDSARHPQRVMVWRARSDSTGEAEPPVGPVVRHEVEPGDRRIEESRVRVVASTIRQEAGDAGEIVRTASLHVVCEIDAATGEERCVSSSPEVDPAAHPFVIMIDDVHAEPDPQQGLVLKIPRLARDPNAAAAAGEDSASAAPGGLAWTRQEEIRLPVPVEEFRSLFADVRRRSLWVFLGVFLVGTVLSAGVASRFTRPVRRLDRAIRRLSEGDLDVRVTTRGEDEIARLGRAFNEMTRSLQVSRQRARELVRREKHSALGRLAAGVAHDIRNPLHSIGLTLQHLSETCRPEDAERAAELDRSLEIIRGEIRRLDALVGNFLRFAKSEARERHAVDLRELLRETERLVRKEAEWREVTIELELPEAVPALEADGEALRSSILNLVLNSFEAMPRGGTLKLALRAETERLVVDVVDTGEGIPEQSRDRVFDFAYTTREGGNGLGLAMVYQCVVEDHGGRVGLDSEPGRGTRVTLELPLRAAAGEAAC